MRMVVIYGGGSSDSPVVKGADAFNNNLNRVQGPVQSDFNGIMSENESYHDITLNSPSTQKCI